MQLSLEAFGKNDTILDAKLRQLSLLLFQPHTAAPSLN